MPIGGKLVLKGGETLGGVKKKDGKKKKKKKKAKKDEAEDEAEPGLEGTEQQPAEGQAAGSKEKKKAGGVTTTGKSYEEEFDLEMARLKEGKVRSTAWGSTFRAAPEVLHGYDKKVTGKTASERLDMRAACKADKFCK